MDDTTSRDLRSVLSVVWRYLPLVVLLPVVAAVIAYLRVQSNQVTYQSSAQVLVQTTSQSLFGNVGYQGQNLAAVPTQVALIGSPAQQEAVRAALGDRVDSWSLVSVDNPPDTDLIDVTVSAPTASQAHTAAQTYVETYVSRQNAAAAATAARRADVIGDQVTALQRDIERLSQQLAAGSRRGASHGAMHALQVEYTSDVTLSRTLSQTAA